MKINKYWRLDKSLHPSMSSSLWSFNCTQEQFDSVTIVHYPSLGHGFKPIILCPDFRVRSMGSYNAKCFYHDVCLILKTKGKKWLGYRASMVGFIWDSYDGKWGCRHFTMSQLRTIKKAMEEYYTREELV